VSTYEKETERLRQVIKVYNEEMGRLNNEMLALIEEVETKLDRLLSETENTESEGDS